MNATALLSDPGVMIDECDTGLRNEVSLFGASLLSVGSGDFAIQSQFVLSRGRGEEKAFFAKRIDHDLGGFL